MTKELSNKELKRLKRIAEGDTAQEIADKECRSKRTIEDSVEKTKEKLGAKNTPNLIYIAMRDELIE